MTVKCKYCNALLPNVFTTKCPGCGAIFYEDEIETIPISYDPPLVRNSFDRGTILDTAKNMVCGKRETDYGTPEDNFQRIAELWSAYKHVDYTPVDVAMMMALLKIGRIATGTATEDSFIDLAGYAACGGEIAMK